MNTSRGSSQIVDKTKAKDGEETLKHKSKRKMEVARMMSDVKIRQELSVRLASTSDFRSK